MQEFRMATKQEVWCGMKDCANNWDGNCEADIAQLGKTEDGKLECQSYAKNE